MRDTMRRVLSSTAVLGLAAGAVGQAEAALVLFTDRLAFQTAVGSLTTETFNSITSDAFFTDSTLAFPSLILRSTGGAVGMAGILVDVPSYEFNPGAGDVNGAARVNLGGLLAGNSVVSIEFKAPVAAVGFDTVNYDINNDRAQAFVGGTLIGTFPAARNLTGFIGVLDTSGATITAVNISTAVSVSGTFNAFDNVSFAVSAVPEPSTFALTLAGVAGLAGVGAARRRRAGGRAERAAVAQPLR